MEQAPLLDMFSAPVGAVPRSARRPLGNQPSRNRPQPRLRFAGAHIQCPLLQTAEIDKVAGNRCELKEEIDSQVLCRSLVSDLLDAAVDEYVEEADAHMEGVMVVEAPALAPIVEDWAAEEREQRREQREQRECQEASRAAALMLAGVFSAKPADLGSFMDYVCNLLDGALSGEAEAFFPEVEEIEQLPSSCESQVSKLPSLESLGSCSRPRLSRQLCQCQDLPEASPFPVDCLPSTPAEPRPQEVFGGAVAQAEVLGEAIVAPSPPQQPRSQLRSRPSRILAASFDGMDEAISCDEDEVDMPPVSRSGSKAELARPPALSLRLCREREEDTDSPPLAPRGSTRPEAQLAKALQLDLSELEDTDSPPLAPRGSARPQAQLARALQLDLSELQAENCEWQPPAAPRGASRPSTALGVGAAGVPPLALPSQTEAAASTEVKVAKGPIVFRLASASPAAVRGQAGVRLCPVRDSSLTRKYKALGAVDFHRIDAEDTQKGFVSAMALDLGMQTHVRAASPAFSGVRNSNTTFFPTKAAALSSSPPSSHLLPALPTGGLGRGVSGVSGGALAGAAALWRREARRARADVF